MIARYPEVSEWVVGGHSLGGAMAGRFAATHPEDVRGMALWAAFPDGDLSGIPGMDALTTSGTLDQGRQRSDSTETLSLLPPDTRIDIIEGGNHEQMGDYTGQPNDPPAAISRDDQRAIARAAAPARVSDAPEQSLTSSEVTTGG